MTLNELKEKMELLQNEFDNIPWNNYTQLQRPKVISSFAKEHNVEITTGLGAKIRQENILINDVIVVGDVRRDTIKVKGLFGEKSKPCYIIFPKTPSFLCPFNVEYKSGAEKLNVNQKINISGIVGASIGRDEYGNVEVNIGQEKIFSITFIET